MKRATAMILAVGLLAGLSGCANDSNGGSNGSGDALIAPAVDSLWAMQQDDGAWPIQSPQFAGGPTAIAAWALLEQGVEPSNADLEKALGQLARLDTQMTYVLALRANAWAQAARTNPDRYKPLLARDIATLIGGSMDGAYTYKTTSDLGLGDQSNSHYAVMGVEAAEEVGIQVPAQYWRTVRDYWLKVQNADGGWPYSREGTPSTATMTVAAICTLALCNERVGATDAARAAIDRGVDWLDRNFDGTLEEPKLSYYYFLSLARMRDLTGRQSVGGVQLKPAITAELRRRQQSGGAWTSGWGDTVSTAYGVLTLEKLNE